jgi:hypothetical protein
VKRLRLLRVRVCPRCGKGRAELATDDGDAMLVPLDPVRARELAAFPERRGDVRSVAELVLAQVAASGAEPVDVVLDLDGAGLRALFSFSRDGEADVVSCTPQEGIDFAVRGGLRLYATDEALAHAAPRAGAGGSETVH